MLLLVPADVLRPQRVDEHFAPEADAARAVGLEVAVVDHDALTRADGAEEAVRRVRSSGVAVYRGWMLRSAEYAAFERSLRQRGVTLRTSAEQYRRAHELPGWYSALAEMTPRSVWTSGSGRAAFDHARRELGTGPVVLRDYTKSMKHYWHEAAFIPDAADPDAAWRVASRFRELRGEDLTGGFVLRRFERFQSAEVRTWWVDGKCRLIGPHPDTPEEMPDVAFDPATVEDAITTLGLPFVTADFALRDDRTWCLVELGDGQVSDRPATIPAEELIALLRAG
ncbi:ATP-grasp domain-containing protein [Nocardia sp. NPDC051929]|uniref:ATP-grasp domain-containing protein n=1 Tax=Nocardia sp. NPDC051929 TaxID=3364327 RepID=UPI0037C80CFB